MPNKKDKDDADVVRFEVSKSDDNKEWDVRVICETGLDEHELGVALHSLGDDLLQDRIAFDSAPAVEEPADEDLH